MYLKPIISTEADYANKVYIDPTASPGGSGTEGSPLQALPTTLNQNTAYLLKRGTSTHPAISKQIVNSMIGAYGTGPIPIITGGFVLGNNSNNSTIRDIEITRIKTGDYDRVLSLGVFDNTSLNVTFAFNRIRGIVDGNGFYPHFGVDRGVNGLVFFNNEIREVENNGWNVDSYHNMKIVRNWIHNVNKKGQRYLSGGDQGQGDGMQFEWGTRNSYIAGNRIDKSNAAGKHGIFMNRGEFSDGVIMEYNTIIAPHVGDGGVALRWLTNWTAEAEGNGICRKNLLRAITESDLVVQGAIYSWTQHGNKTAPYGIRDNHVVSPDSNAMQNYPNDNPVWTSNSAYAAYKAANPEIGLYGSDIDPDTFLTEFDNPDGELGNPINITIVGQGSVAKSPDKALYETGESVILTPTPLSGWEFSHWSGDVTGNENPKTITT